MARRPLGINMGRTRISASTPYGATQAQLRQQFQQSIAGVLDNMKAVIEATEGVLPDILVETLEPTFIKSQVLCPVRTGELRDSGYIEARQGSRTAEVEIGYGRGGHPDYAIFVHEVPQWHQPPTSDKFLQIPLQEDLPDFPMRLAMKIREALGT